ncbi:MAG: chromosomal replication initiator protein DnaA [Paludibacteraceae bacterium]|nr:chromosomal replication initiator protein DnaA [Paludibacteraceae bacterium]
MNEKTNNIDQCEALWAKCLQKFEDNLSEVQFTTWFQPIKPLLWEPSTHTLKLGLPSDFFREYLEGNFFDLLKTTLTHVYGEVNLKYVVNLDKDVSIENGGQHMKKSQPVVTVNSVDNQAAMEQALNPQLNRNYTMDCFVEGKSNKLAKSAGLAISKAPGETPFNPLFIYGGSGLGKTHLANAIGNTILEKHPNKRIIYVDALRFQTQYQDAVRNNNLVDFMHFYQSLDVLIIDDIQELEGKEKTVNTFFHIFNHLHQAGKQLILAADRSPKEIKQMDERMLSRFLWGLSAEISKPDEDMRKAILRFKVDRNALDISDEVIEYIAKNTNGNIRELEGIVNSLLARATLTDAIIDLELAEEVVGKSEVEVERTIDLSDIQEAVCEYYNLDVDAIHTKSRKREVAQARQVAMYLARKFTKKSLAVIGSEIGNRDHATVLHACKTVENLIETDKTIRQSLDTIESKLR